MDETPVISGPVSPEVAENSGTAVATYTATDPDGTGINWVLSGTDDDAFTLSGGALTFNAVPDFETRSQYRITIEAREQTPGTSVARLNVTVRVANVDEPGMVVVPVSEPRVGQQLTPTVEDLDGGVGSIEWKWERRDPGGDWSPIPGATSRSYTPTRDDNGKELRVVAIYRDREGPGKTHTHQFIEAVVLRPYFPSDTDTRSIRENTAEGRNVGSSFTARHPDNVNLTYAVGGIDAQYFTIDNSGQLKTSAIPLDYETLANHEAEVEITASDTQTPPGSATITVTVTVTNECTSSGEPPCAPRTPSVSSASDTSLRVAWSTPGTPSGTLITGYELQYRINGTNDTWTPQFPPGTDRAHTIENLVKDTTYEVQVRATNGNGTSEWSQSGTGTAGFVPPPPPPPPPPVIEEETTTTTNTGGGGGGAFSIGGGGGVSAGPQRPPALVGPQAVTRLFAPLLENGTLERVWRFNNEDKSWTFYDPRPIFAQFNTLRLVRPPVILIVKVTRAQVFRGERLNTGWNFINVR